VNQYALVKDSQRESIRLLLCLMDRVRLKDKMAKN
jgi:hypothetical protein